MPKIVNHEKRREQIAESMWRIILEKGMEGATVRGVAEEAGLSVGALRYYFKDQDELFVYAMRLVNERVTGRVMDIAARPLPPREKVIAVLLEIVPMDDERRAETDVWFSFLTHLKHRKDLDGIPEHAVYEAIQKLFGLLEVEGALRPGLDRELEAERLYSIIDGLALHAFLEPERLDPSMVRRVVRSAVEAITL